MMDRGVGRGSGPRATGSRPTTSSPASYWCTGCIRTTSQRRVSDALDSVRPYLGSHGGDVSLLGVDDGVVRLQFQGSCKSCPSSAVTLELAVEDAVRAAAPEISSIEVVAAEKDSSSGVSYRRSH